MGGELFFGMRNEKGEEKLQLRWTNPVPFIMADPTFLTGGKLWHELWNEKHSKKGWPGTRLVRTIQPSEYGVILVDQMTKKVFSRQDYCTPNMLHLQGTVDPEMCQAIVSKMYKPMYRTRLTVSNPRKFNKKRRFSFYVRPSRTMERKFWDLALKGFGTNDWVQLPAYFQLQWWPKGFTFDFGKERTEHRARYCWDEVVDFVEKNGWSSRVAKVRKPKA